MIYDLASRLSGQVWPGISFYITVKGEPVDLTNCEVCMRFKKPGFDQLEWLLSSDSNDILIEGNKITVIPRLLTLDPRNYVYDVQVTDFAGLVRTYVKGRFEVL